MTRSFSGKLIEEHSKREWQLYQRLKSDILARFLASGTEGPLPL